MQQNTHQLITFFIAMVWLINGLFCKVLNLVPRHQEIVDQILGSSYSRQLTFAIGVSEILMAVWILSGIKPRLCVITQILIVTVMNIIEFLAVPDLLLWGRTNSIFALLFILLLYWNEFKVRLKIN